MEKIIKKNLAFTLAEVLITLMIIGIIASITIPIIIADINNKKMANIFRKNFSELSQATTLIINDNGGSFINACGYWNDSCLYQKYSLYMNTAKTCTNAQAQGCWHQNGQWKYINGTVCNQFTDCNVFGHDSSYHPGGFVLPSGALTVFAMYWNDCDPASGKRCGEILIDLNGFTEPNQIGKDIASIVIQQNGLAPNSVKDNGLSKNYLLNP